LENYVLELIDLRKTYPGGVKALNGLTIRVKPGEIYGLIGPNGAGKTTTLKIIAGLLKPDHGVVRICGKSPVKDRVEALKNISYVPENPLVFKNLTVTEFLKFVVGLRSMKWENVKDHVDYLLEGFNLTDKKNKLLIELSRGMIQKVLVTAALIVKPRLLVMDEPMAGMDPEAQYFFKQTVSDLVEKEGVTALISSHLLDMVEKFCTRVGIISKGKLVAEGRIDEIKKMAGREESLEKVFLEIVRG